MESGRCSGDIFPALASQTTSGHPDLQHPGEQVPSDFKSIARYVDQEEKCPDCEITATVGLWAGK